MCIFEIGVYLGFSLKLENMVCLVIIKIKKLFLYIVYDFVLICVILDKLEVN